MPKVRTLQKHNIGGFTLIEVIVGIVVLAIALTLITSLIVPAARQSVSPVYQVRAAELGQTTLNEVLSKSFDQNSDRQGSRQRCDRPGGPACSDFLGPEPGEQRPDFNDVDDFQGLTQIQSALGDNLSARYPGYQLAINVCYANSSGQCQGATRTSYKRVQVTVTTPEGQALDFSAIRGNF